MSPEVHCPKCGHSVPEDRTEGGSMRSEGTSCWLSCGECNIVFPSPVYQPDVIDSSHPFPVEIIRSGNRLKFRYPSERLLSKCSSRMFALCVTLIYAIVVTWIGIWFAIFICSVFGKYAIPDPIGYFMVGSMLIGLLSCAGGLSSLLWEQETVVFDPNGVSSFGKGLFLPHRYRWISRENFITLHLETYTPDKHSTETMYQLRLETHPTQQEPRGKLDFPSLPTVRKDCIDTAANEIIDFLKTVPSTLPSSSKPTKGILDKQIQGTAVYLTLCCPACRKRHAIKPNELNCYLKRILFQCDFCNHAVEFEKALCEEGVLPPEHETKRGRLRNKITLPGEDVFWKERLSLRTKTQSGN